MTSQKQEEALTDRNAPNENPFPAVEQAVASLVSARDTWARTSIAESISILEDIRTALDGVAPAWVDSAAKAK